MSKPPTFKEIKLTPNPDGSIPLSQLKEALDEPIRPFCPNCDGQGYIFIRNGEDTADCPVCKGKGRL